MEQVIDTLLDILQNTTLKPEYTYEIFVPIFLSFLTAIGSSDVEFNLQNEVAKVFSLINYILDLFRKKPLLAYHELLKIIPHLKEIIGETDYETLDRVKELESKLNEKEKNNLLMEYQKILEKILYHVEKILLIHKNNPYILKQSNIHFMILSLLNKNSFEKIGETGAYSIKKKENNIYLYFDQEKEDNEEDILNKLDSYEIEEDTKIFIGGFGEYGKKAILFSMKPNFKSMLSESKINQNHIYIITIGMSHFCNKEQYNEFHNLRYNIIQIIDMKDKESFRKRELYYPLTIPIIIGPPSQVNEFYTLFFNKTLSENTKPFEKKEYIESLNTIFKNNLHSTTNFEKYKPDDEDNWFLNDNGYFINVSL